VPWAALRPNHPRRGWRPGGRDTIAVGDVHPWFLADAIRFYADNPGVRGKIGTPEGYEELQKALGLHSRH
jgi:hypothetical protein